MFAMFDRHTPGYPQALLTLYQRCALSEVWGDPKRCAAGVQVPYCTPQQPPWSAYREDAFGHGILEIKVGI